MNAETFNLEQALSDILNASPGPAREFAYGYHWKRLAASEGHMRRLPALKPPPECQYADTIQRMMNEGMQHIQIAEALGISRGRVSNIISQHGLKRANAFRLTDLVDKDELQRLVDNGLPLTKIGEKFGFSDNTVRRAIIRLGVNRGE